MIYDKITLKIPQDQGQEQLGGTDKLHLKIVRGNEDIKALKTTTEPFNDPGKVSRVKNGLQEYDYKVSELLAGEEDAKGKAEEIALTYREALIGFQRCFY